MRSIGSLYIWVSHSTLCYCYILLGKAGHTYRELLFIIWILKADSECYSFCYQALHVAGQVAGASVSTSPLPYGAMTSQCEALGLGTRKKLSSWLVNGHESTPDNPMPSLPSSHHSIIPRVRRLININPEYATIMFEVVNPLHYDHMICIHPGELLWFREHPPHII
jgi:hypothetical protein